MMTFANSLVLALTTFSHLASPASAQASNTTSACSPRDPERFETYNLNSTGSVEFELPQQDPWYLTLGLSDHRHELDIRVAQWLDLYLSVPQSLLETEPENQPTYCIYRFAGQNETSNNKSNEQSCDDIISEKCRDAIRNTGPPSNGRCSSADVKDECGFSVVVTSISPTNFSSPDCSDDDLKNINVPDDYRTYVTVGGGDLPPYSQEFDVYSGYDLNVRRSIPFLLMVQFPDQSSSNVPIVLCASPDNIVGNSRIPEEDFPKNAASRFEGRTAMLVASMVSCLVALMLV